MINCTTQSAAHSSARDLLRQLLDADRAGRVLIARVSAAFVLIAVLSGPTLCSAQFDPADSGFRSDPARPSSSVSTEPTSDDSVWTGYPSDRHGVSAEAAATHADANRPGFAPSGPALRSGSGTAMLSDSGRDSRQFPPDAIPLARRDKPDEGITAGERSSASGPGIGQVIIALCVVLLVIVGLARIVLGKGMHLPGGLPRDVVDVLGRRMVDGKNSLVLVRLGGKLLLLSSSPGGLSAVTEVTDPIEVASLTTLTKAAQDAPASNFRTVLGRFLSPRHSQSAPVGSFAERLRAVLPTAPEPLPISEVESNRFSRQGERA